MKFHSGEIAVQTRAGVTEDAAEVGEGIVDRVPDAARAFLSTRRMVVIATIDARSRVWASVVTGEPGFLSLLDDRNLRIGVLPPEGDPLLENLRVEGHVALFIPDLVAPRRIRLNGTGQIKGSEIRVHAEQVYGNCRRYIQERLLVGTRASSAALPVHVTRSTELSSQDRDQILRADTFFVATEYPEAGADASHKGGNPGFVRYSTIDASRFLITTATTCSTPLAIWRLTQAPDCCSSISTADGPFSSLDAHPSTGIRSERVTLRVPSG
jgi:uncharacterized protein